MKKLIKKNYPQVNLTTHLRIIYYSLSSALDADAPINSPEAVINSKSCAVVSSSMSITGLDITTSSINSPDAEAVINANSIPCTTGVTGQT